MITEKSNIFCESVFDKKERNHRYRLTKIWDEKKPLVAVVTISPSPHYNLKIDLTTTLIQSAVVSLDENKYGGFHLLNLLTKVGKTPKKGSVKDCVNKDSDKILVESCKSAEVDKIIIAWGSVSNKTKELAARADDVVALLTPFEDKLYFLSDGKRQNLHPLTSTLRGENGRWELSKISLKKENVIPAGSWDGSIEVE